MREAAAQRAPPQLLGKILYLEQLTVSFDGFKALNDLTLYVDPGELRCIIGPNGAGKTTMMDVITGKTRPDSGSAWFGAERQPAAPQRARDRAGRHRPQVSEADRLRAPDGLREPRAGARRAQVVLDDAPGAPDVPTTSSASTRCSRSSALKDARAARAGIAVARPEAVAGDRDAAHAGAGAAARRRAGGRHDAAGDRADRRAAAVARRQALGRRRRARHGVRPVDRQPGDGAARGERARRGRHGHGAERSHASSRCISAHEPADRYEPQSVVRRQSHAVGRRPQRCRRARAPVSWAATAWGRRRCSSASWACCRSTSGEIAFRRHRHPRARRPRAARASASATCRRGARSFRSSRSRRTCGSDSARARTAPQRPAADLRAVSGAEADAAAAAAATSPAGSSSSWRSAARSCSSRRCSSSTSRPRGFSRTSCTRSATSFCALNREAGVTVLLVEQKLPFARRVASEFRILEKGRCVADGRHRRADRRRRSRAPQRVSGHTRAQETGPCSASTARTDRPACRSAAGRARRADRRSRRRRPQRRDAGPTRTSPLRLLMPRNHGRAAWVYTSSFGGGLVDGDRLVLDIEVGAGAAAFVSTQASTKVYRSPRRRARSPRAQRPTGCSSSRRIRSSASRRPGIEQTQRFDLAADAGLVLVDWVTSGRHASGERWAFDEYARAFGRARSGTLVVHDALALRPRTATSPTGWAGSTCWRGAAARRAASTAPRAIVARAAQAPVTRRADHCWPRRRSATAACCAWPARPSNDVARRLRE